MIIARSWVPFLSRRHRGADRSLARRAPLGAAASLGNDRARGHAAESFNHVVSIDGTGKGELVAEIVGIRRQGDYLIMEMETTEPVRWKIRGGVSRMDLRVLLKAILKLSVLRSCSILVPG